MASLFPGFEYDIFISYRHNDNRSGWVTEFVGALKEELAATIKEPLSIYFDQNPHDGLLETHQVDKSLEGKLKCFVFIPIISQTYCDPKSFAWQHEFIAFNKLSKEDSLGRDILLNNGNVASRILPVKIHELDTEDQSIIEEEIDGALRAIEFIYKEPGVNRPLNHDDNESNNLNKTRYRNQINKLAIGIKDEITAVLKPSATIGRQSSLPSQQRITNTDHKSIVVLPFVNMSNDPDQEYFSDGLTEEIITDLSQINDLLVISRSTAMTFKKSSKKISEIANELNVQHVLEGSVRKAGNQIRITAQLINASTDGHLWAEKYDSNFEDIFNIQENVSRSIVASLKVQISPKVDAELSSRPIKSADAYDYILKAKMEIRQWQKDAYDKALDLQKKALAINGPNAPIYAEMALTYFSYANLGIDAEENIISAEEYIQKTFELDPESPEGNFTFGLLQVSFRGNALLGIQHIKKTLLGRPNDFDANFWLYALNSIMGKKSTAQGYLQQLRLIEPSNIFTIIGEGPIELYQGNFKEAIKHFEKGLTLAPKISFIVFLHLLSMACLNINECRVYLSNKTLEPTADMLDQLIALLKHILTGGPDQSEQVLKPKLEAWAKRDPQYSHFFAQIFSLVEMKNEAFHWLENAVGQGFCNYPLLSGADPVRKLLGNEQRFQDLLIKVKSMWNEFE